MRLTPKSVVLAVALLVVVAAAGYGLFGFLLVSSDHATYASDGRQLDDVDYDAVLATARDAGYAVDAPYYVNAKTAGGVHPDGVADLDARFGDDYRVFEVVVYHTDDRYLAVSLTGDDAPRVSVFDDGLGVDEPFTPANLPPEDWLVAQFQLLFDLSETEARDYVADLRATIEADAPDIPHVYPEESLAFESVYAAFTERATSVSGTESGGDGWYGATYADADGRFAEIDFVVQSARITTRVDGAEYVLKLDRLGGANLRVRLDPGEELAEAEYRAVFEELFREVGLPPEAVAGFEFEYTASNW